MQDVTLQIAEATGPRLRGRRSAGDERARSRSADARGGLGTNDGICFTFPPERTAQERAEALDWDTGELVYSDEKRRLARWEMQTAARQLIAHRRLNQCYRVPVDEVRVWRRPTSATYYRGLRVCGMVWACPVCAAKIAERRRVELVTAMDAHKLAGGSVLMMTLTVPHTREDAAFSLLARLLKAYRAFSSGKRAWGVLLPGYVGSVRALEVTHGQANGWHPHLHVLVFLAGEVKPDDYTDVLLAQWAKVTKRHGLADVNAHGLRLDDGAQAARYASKWGLEDEMTKAHIKQGRKGGNRTPWALLADYTAGDKGAAHLFREFVTAFKGKSQLQWSRGLKARFSLDEDKTDEQLAAEKVDALDLLVARFTPEDWKLIRTHELRGQVLELLRSATWEAVDLLLSNYRARGRAPDPPRKFRGGGLDCERIEEGSARAGNEERCSTEAGTVPSSGAESRTGASDRENEQRDGTPTGEATQQDWARPARDAGGEHETESTREQEQEGQQAAQQAHRMPRADSKRATGERRSSRGGDLGPAGPDGSPAPELHLV